MRAIIFLLQKVINKAGHRFYPWYYTRVARIKFYSMRINYGKGLYVDGKIVVSLNKSQIQIGQDVTIRSRYNGNLVGMTNPTTFQVMPGGAIILGNGTGMSSTILSSRKLIRIGNYVMIGANVRIFDHDFHSMNPLDRRPGGKDYENVKIEEVVIEDDVFIGTNSIILKGVHIGKGSIIAAGSVVSLKNIPPYSLVGGNPAILIRQNETL